MAESRQVSRSGGVFVDAWKLYCEAFRVLWPDAEKVSDTVSPAALQEMVDRMLATGGVIYQAMLKASEDRLRQIAKRHAHHACNPVNALDRVSMQEEFRCQEIIFYALKEAVGAPASENRAQEGYPGIAHDLETMRAEVTRLQLLINSPQTGDYFEAVRIEAAHQQERWGSDHDAGKAAEDWFWLLGYLGGKALHSFKAGDTAKGLHHIISSAASLLNWHRRVTGEASAMRPGIEPPTEINHADAR